MMISARLLAIHFTIFPPCAGYFIKTQYCLFSGAFWAMLPCWIRGRLRKHGSVKSRPEPSARDDVISQDKFDNWRPKQRHRHEPDSPNSRPFIDQAEFVAAMSGFVWLVSHGGVGSEHLYDQLNLAYP